MSSSTMARMLSVGNATRLLRALPKRTFASISGTAANQATLRTPSPFTQQQSAFSPRFFSSTSSTARPHFAVQSTPLTKASSAFHSNSAASASPSMLQGQAVRNFSRHAWQQDREAIHQAAREYWASGRGPAGDHASLHHHELHKHARDHWHRRCGGLRSYHHHHHQYPMRRRRPIRFLFRMAALSTVLIAVPAVVCLDAPFNTLGYVPLTVFGAGAALMVAGKLLYVFLPIVMVGGATLFWVTAMPVVDHVKDVRSILKRDQEAGRYSTTALSMLGSEWEIQTARPDEYFRWKFPERSDPKQLDKIDIRMVVFDPNDRSAKKERAMRKIGKLQECKQHKMSSRRDGHFPDSFDIRRDGDQIVVTMEEDGEHLMNMSMAKQYLALGRIVNRAAKEMEAAQPGMKLGEQVVLVHRNRRADSFWAQWSPFSDLSLRIPVNRTWVNDMSDL